MKMMKAALARMMRGMKGFVAGDEVVV